VKPGLIPAGQRAMPIRLDSRSADFAARFSAFLATKREVSEDVDQAVRAIIADVRKNGDRALTELSRKFDRIDLDRVGLRVSAHAHLCRRGGTAEQIGRAHHRCQRHRRGDGTAVAHPALGGVGGVRGTHRRGVDGFGVHLRHRERSP